LVKFDHSFSRIDTETDIFILHDSADKTGLPSPETLDALKSYNLLRIDQNGWSEVSADGTQM
jgi:hypothetical protein